MTHIHSSTKGGKTETFTTTEKVTKTVRPVPIPGPTEGAGKVRDTLFKGFAYTCSNMNMTGCMHRTTMCYIGWSDSFFFGHDSGSLRELL